MTSVTNKITRPRRIAQSQTHRNEHDRIDVTMPVPHDMRYYRDLMGLELPNDILGDMVDIILSEISRRVIHETSKKEIKRRHVE